EAKVRAAEVNAKFEEIVAKAREGIVMERPEPVKVAAPVFPTQSPIIGRETVKELARDYLSLRSNELRHGGFKSVRFSIGLLVSLYGTRQVGSLSRDDGRRFVSLVAQLSPHVGKSYQARGLGLEQLVQRSSASKVKITAHTQKRIVSQVLHFLEWAYHEGRSPKLDFGAVRVEAKGRINSYAVPTDEEVQLLLVANHPVIGSVLQFCLLSGLRSGEAVGLLREDLVWKGNLGWFIQVRPNRVRQLKTDAAERVVPLHDQLSDRLPSLGEDRLFPELTVSRVTKQFARLRADLDLDRRGLVFHSTRKWFITQCERTGVRRYARRGSFMRAAQRPMVAEKKFEVSHYDP
ncbi:MAG: integrase, partial [Rhodobacteraceae bacterium]|nr:integrase [Paracoccaceae bacterium]